MIFSLVPSFLSNTTIFFITWLCSMYIPHKANVNSHPSSVCYTTQSHHYLPLTNTFLWVETLTCVATWMVTMFFVVNTKYFKIYTSHFSLLTPPYHTHNVLTSHDNKTIHIVLSTILCVTTHSTPHYPRSSFTTHVLFLLTTFLYPSHSTYPHSHLITSELTPSPLFCFHGVAQSPPQLH